MAQTCSDREFQYSSDWDWQPGSQDCSTSSDSEAMETASVHKEGTVLGQLDNVTGSDSGSDSIVYPALSLVTHVKQQLLWKAGGCTGSKNPVEEETVVHIEGSDVLEKGAESEDDVGMRGEQRQVLHVDGSDRVTVGRETKINGGGRHEARSIAVWFVAKWTLRCQLIFRESTVGMCTTHPQ